jgi:hypothetical protein
LIIGASINSEKIFRFGEEYVPISNVEEEAENLFKQNYLDIDSTTPSFKEFYAEFLEKYEDKYEDQSKIKEKVKKVYDKFTKNPQQLSLFESRIREIIRNYFLKSNS